MVYTSCYSHPDDLAFFEGMERVFEGAGGVIRPVYLQRSVAELERRIANPDRVAMRKLRSVGGLRSELARWNWVAVPRADCMTIATDGHTPGACADEIIAALSLVPQASETASLRDRGTEA